MRISGAIIQNRNIEVSTRNKFVAIYKKKRINVSDGHKSGKPDEWWLTRYSVEVIDIKTGIVDVDSYKDCHEIRDAIRYALCEACLVDFEGTD